MFMSLIICTKNRASQLKECLDRIAAADKPPCDYEVILVDSSVDSSSTVISDFISAAPMKASCLRCEPPGLGLARNVGLEKAQGEWLLFTDDDCYVENDYFTSFFDFATEINTADGPLKDVRFGGGPVGLYDNAHDPRIANLTVHSLKFIPARTLIAAGAIQGANMFYHRSIFTAIGPFNAMMGAGTPFGCEDIEMAARASLAGFVGAIVPLFRVTHHHMRLRGSKEANAVVTAYDYGRGAYYASLLDRGIADVWKLWQMNADMQHFKNPGFRVRMIRELEGAANYLKALG